MNSASLILLYFQAIKDAINLSVHQAPKKLNENTTIKRKKHRQIVTNIPLSVSIGLDNSGLFRILFRTNLTQKKVSNPIMKPIIIPRELPFHLAASQPTIALHPIGVVNASIDMS